MRAFAAALVLSVSLALWALWPAWTAPGSWLVGQWVHPDCLGNHWLLVWVAEQIAGGHGIVHNDRYWWPVGDAPVLAGNGAEGFVYLPFHLALGWPAGVVAYAILVLTLDGMAGWTLGRAAGADPWASLVPAAASGLAPYVMQEMSSGRFSQSSTCWMLFAVASWLAFLRNPSARRAALAGALVAVASFFYWYYGWFAALAAGSTLLACRPLPPIRLVFLSVFVWLVLISPWAWLFFDHWRDIPGTAESDAFPHPQAMLDTARVALPFLVHEGRDAGQAMAATVWLAGAAGVALALRNWRTEPAARGLVLVWLVFALLALGPSFPAAPYTLLYGLAAPLRRFWWPIRHVAVANVAWAVLAALAVSRLRRPVLPSAALAMSVPLALAVQGAPRHVSSGAVALPPDGYPELAELPDGVLLEVPLAPQAAGSQAPLAYQLFHHKTLLSGHAPWVDRVRPDAWDAFVDKNSFLRAIMALDRGEAGGRVSFDPADLERLRTQGVRWVALNREYFVFDLRGLADAYERLMPALFGEPVIRARRLKIWDAANWTGTSDVPVPDFRWPAGVHPGGPEMPLVGLRPRSTVFDAGLPDGATAP